MTIYKYGALLLEKPINEVLQRWRISLASLLFFTIFLTDNFGLSTSSFGYNVSNMSGRRILQENGDKIDGKDFNPNPNSCYYNSSNINQCLVLPYSSMTSNTGTCNFVDEICCEGKVMKSGKKRTRIQLTRNVTLPFCSNFKIYNLLDQECFEAIKSRETSPDDCKKSCLANLLKSDQEAYANFYQFEKLLARYDCEANFSVNTNCTKCKEKYKMWLCTNLIPYYLSQDEEPGSSRKRVYPCIDFCEDVEGHCPYFLPHIDNQYAGEPSFLCTDRLIPHANEQPMGYPCYKPCHLNRTIECDTPIEHRDNTTHSTSGGSHTGISSPHHGLLVAQLTVLWLLRTTLQYMSVGLT